MNSLDVLVLRTLNKENHQERHNGRACIYKELPVAGKSEYRTCTRLYDNDRGCVNSRPRAAGVPHSLYRKFLYDFIYTISAQHIMPEATHGTFRHDQACFILRSARDTLAASCSTSSSMLESTSR